jgi:hypothetical protein
MESEFNDIHCFSIPGKRCHFAIPHMADAQVKDFVSKLCKKQACAIQFCLQANGYRDDRCQKEVESLIKCCQQLPVYHLKHSETCQGILNRERNHHG